MYATTWLERLFQSCQRKTHTNSFKDEQQTFSDHQRFLTYEQLPNFGNDALVSTFRQIFRFFDKIFFAFLDLVLGDLGIGSILRDE